MNIIHSHLRYVYKHYANIENSISRIIYSLHTLDCTEDSCIIDFGRLLIYEIYNIYEMFWHVFMQFVTNYAQK